MSADTTKYSEKEVLQALKDFVDSFPTKEQAAEALGIGRVFLWKVLTGDRKPSSTILDKIGFTKQREIVYYYTKKEGSVAKTKENA